MTDISVPKSIKAVRLVGVASGRGARDTRCEAAPLALRAGLARRLRRHGLRTRWTRVIGPPLGSGKDSLAAVRDICIRLADCVGRIVERDELPVVIGGDHSCAIGTWKGVAHVMQDHGCVGLLWIDAHMDAHTPQTSDSGRLHGMPVACLLGEGYAGLTAIAEGARLDPGCVCLYGVRSFEAGEAALIERLGVRVFFMEEIERRGVRATLREAFGIVRRAKAGFGITLDMDAIDPREAPGVGSPAPGGLAASALIDGLAEHGADPRLLGIEIVEYNPFLDSEARTAAIAADALDAILLGLPTPGVSSAITVEQRYRA